MSTGDTGISKEYHKQKKELKVLVIPMSGTGAVADRGIFLSMSIGGA
jgi:hypothetical protein